jgi:hypothetical protein
MEPTVTKDARSLKPGDKVYSTAKFLTLGIREMAVDSIYIGVVWAGSFKERHRGLDWHLTLRDAERRALDIVHAKLRSLGKQRRNLESLRDDLMRKIHFGDRK